MAAAFLAPAWQDQQQGAAGLAEGQLFASSPSSRLLDEDHYANSSCGSRAAHSRLRKMTVSDVQPQEPGCSSPAITPLCQQQPVAGAEPLRVHLEACHEPGARVGAHGWGCSVVSTACVCDLVCLAFGSGTGKGFDLEERDVCPAGRLWALCVIPWPACAYMSTHMTVHQEVLDDTLFRSWPG